MRLKRPSQAIAAIRCPSCRAIFEVKSAELQEEPIIAELVNEAPLEAVIMDDPIAENQGASAPNSPLSIIDLDEFDTTSFPPNSSQFEPPKPRNRNRASTAQAPNAVASAAANSSQSRKIKLPIGIGSGSVLLIAILGFVAVKVLFNSGPSGSSQLVDRYRDALTSAKDALARQASQPDTATINAEVDRMQLVLIDCVRLPGADDAQLKDVRSQLDALASLNREVKRNCTLLPLASSRGTKVDQLPIMIDLIEKQLNYGHRKVVDNKERPNRFLIEAFEQFRTMDRQLAESLKNAEAPDLNSMGSILDRLDESCVRYGEAALDRFEMTFEQKQIFECGESFRKWSLNQLSQAGHEKQCVGLGKEIDAEKRRFEQALRATRLDSLTLSGLDRINKRIAEPTGTLFSSAENSKSTIDSKTNSKSDSLAGSPESSRDSNSTGSTPETPKSSPNNELVAKSPNEPSNNGSGFSNRPEASVIASSLNAARQEFGQKPNSDNATTKVSIDPNQAPMFPEARFRMGDSLAIKMVTRKSKEELDQLATLLSRKFGAPIVDVQMRGNLATISFGTFPRKPSAIIPDLSFGKVEICDSQSRTVFINDYE